MHSVLKFALGALITTIFSGQALACYTVYNRANQVVYQALAAPVDMRYQLHETLPSAFPGGHMVFSITDTSCPQVNTTRVVNANRTAAVLADRNAFAGDGAMARGSAVTLRTPRN
jgi:hypothetical protein